LLAAFFSILYLAAEGKSNTLQPEIHAGISTGIFKRKRSAAGRILSLLINSAYLGNRMKRL